TVQMHGASSALREAAAEVGVVETQSVAQGVQQRHLGLGVDGNAPAVDGEAEARHSSLYGRLPECKLSDFGDGEARVLRSYIRPTVQGGLPCGLDGFRNRHLISFASSKLKERYRFESIPGHPVCHHWSQITCATLAIHPPRKYVNRLRRLRAVVLLVRPSVRCKRPGDSRHLVGQGHHH